MLLLTVVLSGAYALPGSAQDSFADDNHWDARFGPPDLFSYVRHVAATEDYLLVTGQKYTEDGFTTFATVYRAVQGDEVHALTIPGWEAATPVAGDTRVYAWRDRNDAAVAELDLTAGEAHPLPDPPGASPWFTTYGDTLFALTGGQVQRWTGEAWESRGPPLDLSTGEVADWAAGASGVFVAIGPGSICDPQDCTTALWQLDQGGWTQIGVAGNSTNPPVSALTVDSRGRLVIAGTFTEINDAAVAQIARWDGRAWSALGHGPGAEIGFIGDLVAVDTMVYAAGNRVLAWTGTTWDALGTRPDAYVRLLAATNDRLYAAGSFTAIGDTVAYRMAEWEAQERRWLPVFPVMGAGIDDEVRALAVGPDGAVFAGGYFTVAGGVRARHVVRWDSTRWWSVGDGPADPVYALAVGTSRLYAGTQHGVAMTDLQNPSWSYLPGLPDGRPLTDVFDLLVHRDTLYVTARAGTFPFHSAGVFRWTGSTWQTVGEVWRGDAPGYVVGLAIDEASMLYAGGEFSRIGDVEARNIARWDGTAWQALGEGLEPFIDVVEAGGGRVYAGGGADGSVFIWDPTTQRWSSVPLPPITYEFCVPVVSALLWQPDGLYAGGGGICPTSDKNEVEQDFALARWNGDTWQVPGSGIHGGVHALAASGDDLYVAGTFRQAGTHAASNIARWNTNVRLPIAGPDVSFTTHLDANYPNPFSSSTVIRFSLERPAAQARLEVFDLLGRRVARLLEGPLAAGTHDVVFDARGLAGGLYVYHLSVDGRTSSRKMLLVR